MDYMFNSRNHENINNLNQEEEPPLFLHFPSPFLDDMDTTTMIPNLHHISTDVCTTTTATTTTTTKLKERFTSKLKSVRKKRSVGKKDRHSKIHTAQGLRDRRMRLSVHTARKFFDLNDMLGFDKASKTIEWLFSKSQKAIDEVTETLQSDDTTQTKETDVMESPLSACETESVMKINKDESLEIQGDRIEDENSRNPTASYPLVSESTSEVRARETDRTINTMMMMEHLEKPKQLYHGQSQLGFSGDPDSSYNMEKSSCYPLEYSNTYHFLKHLHLDNTARDSDTYLGNITNNSSPNCSQYDYNKTIVEPPAGWLNSRNTFLGFLGGWDSENSRMESNNGILPNIAPLRSNIIGENHSSGLMSTNYSNFHSQNQGQ